VEGAHVRASLRDVTDHAIHILENVSRRYAQDMKTFTTEHRVACCIALRQVTDIMRLAVNLNDKASLQTGEIGCHPYRSGTGA
jgi:hypothetical protein